MEEKKLLPCNRNEKVKLELYKNIGRLIDWKYAEVENGKCYILDELTLDPKDEISIENIRYQSIPKDDGIYRLCKCTCASPDCEIGKPKKECVDTKTYSKKKCAVYSLEIPEKLFIKVSDILEIIGNIHS